MTAADTAARSRVRAQESVDFQEFAVGRSGQLFRTAFLLTAGDAHLAEDLVQEALGQALAGAAVLGVVAAVGIPLLGGGGSGTAPVGTAPAPTARTAVTAGPTGSLLESAQGSVDDLPRGDGRIAAGTDDAAGHRTGNRLGLGPGVEVAPCRLPARSDG
ncbi:hypothetical protein ABUW04_14695 [Streptacidiphilus sp. N1-10]|uniref:Uncharacterized protein n=1 Tax=Streptacidiphilus jeojiensis TaxID=3229225 RepID=A0ABV6XNC2_9ACTN